MNKTITLNMNDSEVPFICKYLHAWVDILQCFVLISVWHKMHFEINNISFYLLLELWKWIMNEVNE